MSHRIPQTELNGPPREPTHGSWLPSLGLQWTFAASALICSLEICRGASSSPKSGLLMNGQLGGSIHCA